MIFQINGQDGWTALRKKIALFLSFSLVFSSNISYAEPAFLTVDSSEKISAPSPLIPIPEAFGKIDMSLSGASNKTIIYIQDAHDSLEAQENIARLIAHLVQHHDVKTVYEEGYEGPVPTDKYFNSLKDPKVKERVSYFLMDRLRLSGAEYAHINRKKNFKLIGADSLQDHLVNIAQYRHSSQFQKETARDLDAIQKELTKLADRYFPKEFKDWLKIKDRLDEKKLDLLDYMKRCQDLIAKKMLPQRFQELYPYISLLLAVRKDASPDTLRQVQQIDPEGLFREIDQMEQDYASSLLHRKRDLTVFRYYKILRFFKRLNAIEVPEAEFEAIRETLGQFKTADLARFIMEQTGKSLVFSKRFEDYLRETIRFYEIAQARDASIEKQLARFAAEPEEKTAVLVFGGFHKTAVQEILKKHHFSYHIVIPRIQSRDERHKAYYKQLMTEGKHPYELPSNVVHSRTAQDLLEARSELPANLGIASRTESSIQIWELNREQGLQMARTELRVMGDLAARYPNYANFSLAAETALREAANSGATTARSEVRKSGEDHDLKTHRETSVSSRRFQVLQEAMPSPRHKNKAFTFFFPSEQVSAQKSNGRKIMSGQLREKVLARRKQGFPTSNAALKSGDMADRALYKLITNSPMHIYRNIFDVAIEHQNREALGWPSDERYLSNQHSPYYDHRFLSAAKRFGYSLPIRRVKTATEILAAARKRRAQGMPTSFTALRDGRYADVTLLRDADNASVSFYGKAGDVWAELKVREKLGWPSDDKSLTEKNSPYKDHGLVAAHVKFQVPLPPRIKTADQDLRDALHERRAAGLPTSLAVLESKQYGDPELAKKVRAIANKKNVLLTLYPTYDDVDLEVKARQKLDWPVHEASLIRSYEAASNRKSNLYYDPRLYMAGVRHEYKFPSKEKRVIYGEFLKQVRARRAQGLPTSSKVLESGKLADPDLFKQVSFTHLSIYLDPNDVKIELRNRAALGWRNYSNELTNPLSPYYDLRLYEAAERFGVALPQKPNGLLTADIVQKTRNRRKDGRPNSADALRKGPFADTALYKSISKPRSTIYETQQDVLDEIKVREALGWPSDEISLGNRLSPYYDYRLIEAAKRFGYTLPVRIIKIADEILAAARARRANGMPTSMTALTSGPYVNVKLIKVAQEEKVCFYANAQDVAAELAAREQLGWPNDLDTLSDQNSPYQDLGLIAAHVRFLGIIMEQNQVPRTERPLKTQAEILQAVRERRFAGLPTSSSALASVEIGDPELLSAINAINLGIYETPEDLQAELEVRKKLGWSNHSRALLAKKSLWSDSLLNAALLRRQKELYERVLQRRNKEIPTSLGILESGDMADAELYKALKVGTFTIYPSPNDVKAEIKLRRQLGWPTDETTLSDTHSPYYDPDIVIAARRWKISLDIDERKVLERVRKRRQEDKWPTSTMALTSGAFADPALLEDLQRSRMDIYQNGDDVSAELAAREHVGWPSSTRALRDADSPFKDSRLRAAHHKFDVPLPRRQKTRTKPAKSLPDEEKETKPAKKSIDRHRTVDSELLQTLRERRRQGKPTSFAALESKEFGDVQLAARMREYKQHTFYPEPQDVLDELAVREKMGWPSYVSTLQKGGLYRDSNLETAAQRHRIKLPSLGSDGLVAPDVMAKVLARREKGLPMSLAALQLEGMADPELYQKLKNTRSGTYRNFDDVATEVRNRQVLGWPSDEISLESKSLYCDYRLLGAAKRLKYALPVRTIKTAAEILETARKRRVDGKPTSMTALSAGQYADIDFFQDVKAAANVSLYENSDDVLAELAVREKLGWPSDLTTLTDKDSPFKDNGLNQARTKYQVSLPARPKAFDVELREALRARRRSGLPTSLAALESKALGDSKLAAQVRGLENKKAIYLTLYPTIDDVREEVEARQKVGWPVHQGALVKEFEPVTQNPSLYFDARLYWAGHRHGFNFPTLKTGNVIYGDLLEQVRARRAEGMPTSLKALESGKFADVVLYKRLQNTGKRIYLDPQDVRKELANRAALGWPNYGYELSDPKSLYYDSKLFEDARRFGVTLPRRPAGLLSVEIVQTTRKRRERGFPNSLESLKEGEFADAALYAILSKPIATIYETRQDILDEVRVRSALGWPSNWTVLQEPGSKYYDHQLLSAAARLEMPLTEVLKTVKALQQRRQLGYPLSQAAFEEGFYQDRELLDRMQSFEVNPYSLPADVIIELQNRKNLQWPNDEATLSNSSDRFRDIYLISAARKFGISLDTAAETEQLRSLPPLPEFRKRYPTKAVVLTARDKRYEQKKSFKGSDLKYGETNVRDVRLFQAAEFYGVPFEPETKYNTMTEIREELGRRIKEKIFTTHVTLIGGKPKSKDIVLAYQLERRGVGFLVPEKLSTRGQLPAHLRNARDIQELNEQAAHKILGVRWGAGDHEIREARNRLLETLHPDINDGGMGGPDRPETEEITRIVEATEQLRGSTKGKKAQREFARAAALKINGHTPKIMEFLDPDGRDNSDRIAYDPERDERVIRPNQAVYEGIGRILNIPTEDVPEYMPAIVMVLNRQITEDGLGHNPFIWKPEPLAALPAPDLGLEDNHSRPVDFKNGTNGVNGENEKKDSRLEVVDREAVLARSEVRKAQLKTPSEMEALAGQPIEDLRVPAAVFLEANDLAHFTDAQWAELLILLKMHRNFDVYVSQADLHLADQIPMLQRLLSTSPERVHLGMQNRSKLPKTRILIHASLTGAADGRSEMRSIQEAYGLQRHVFGLEYNQGGAISAFLGIIESWGDQLVLLRQIQDYAVKGPNGRWQITASYLASVWTEMKNRYAIAWSA